ncbi:hypothetical protein [Blastomonas sp.]|uniref:hypothetical protein n=1 Tax=Blastomonas sp. TaxID=1909299 RepID=UPI00406A5131
MSIGYLLAVMAEHARSTKPARAPRRRRDIVHVITPEPLGKRAKRRARGKSKGRK